MYATVLCTQLTWHNADPPKTINDPCELGYSGGAKLGGPTERGVTRYDWAATRWGSIDRGQFGLAPER
jgi:hypothetical protein